MKSIAVKHLTEEEIAESISDFLSSAERNIESDKYLNEAIEVYEKLLNNTSIYQKALVKAAKQYLAIKDKSKIIYALIDSQAPHRITRQSDKVDEIKPYADERFKFATIFIHEDDSN